MKRQINSYRAAGLVEPQSEDPARIEGEVDGATREEAIELFCRRHRVKRGNFLELKFVRSQPRPWELPYGRPPRSRPNQNLDQTCCSRIGE